MAETRMSRGPVRLLAAANGVSATGSLAAYTALTYEVYRRTGSPYWVSAAAFVSFALAGAAAPVAGWLADRYDRRRVMIGSDLAAAVVYLAAAALASSPVALIALTAVGAAAQAPFHPASMAALPNIAAAKDLNWANGLLGSTYSAGIVAGPVAGGLLLSTTGAGGAFLANAGSFILSALLVARVRGRFQPAPTAGERPKVDRGSGYRLALADGVLRTVLIVEALFTLGFGIGIAGDAPLAKDLGAGPGGYAAIITGWGIGQVLAGLAMTRWPERPPRADLRALGGGLAVMGVAMFATAALPDLWQVVAVQFIGGVGMTAVYVLRSGVIQRSAPDAVRGRVFAALDSVMSAGSLAGLAMSGVVIGAFGVRSAYATAGALATLGAVIAIGIRLESRPVSPSAQAS
jgi:MFS family permease